MARRTVEDFNGFVVTAARAPATKTAATSRVRRSRPAATTASGKKSAAPGTTKTTTAAASPKPATDKRDRYSNNNARPSAKVMEKPAAHCRNAAIVGNSKVVPAAADDKVKRAETTNVERNEMKMARRKEDEVIGETGVETVEFSSSDLPVEYEDDFEDYESDFESDNSVAVDSPPSAPPVRVAATNRANSRGNGDGENFALPAVCVEEKLHPFLDEKFVVDSSSLERTVEMGLKNFQNAGKRKREQDAKERARTRGSVLMEMIKLDTVSYALLDLPAIPYEQYIKLYGRSNTAQIQTQTNDDNAEKEVQTNEIDTADKWTQRPVALTNGLDCWSSEYLSAKLGVGDPADASGRDAGRRSARIATADPDRVCAVGRTILSMLDERAMNRAEHRLVRDDRSSAFSDGYLSPAIPSIGFLAGRPVASVQFARTTTTAFSPIESLVTTHQTMDACHGYVVCIWSVPNMDSPAYVLKCPNRVTSICTVPKSTGGFVAAAHADGSICVWDLRESRLHQQQIDRLPCPLRSPSFNTALSIDHGHRSKIVGLCTVTYSNAGDTNDELPDEICSLDEDFTLTVWTVVDNRTDAAEISEHRNAGTAPWSSVRLVKTQKAEANKNVPKYLSDGVAPTCMCLNDVQDAFIGTSSGLVFRYNLGENRVRPSYYACEDTDEHFSVNCLHICPFDSNYFLAACSNGEVMVYRATRREVLRRLSVSSGPRLAPVVRAQWCAGSPGLVIGLDSLSSVHSWDICDDDVSTPTTSVSFPSKTVTSISSTSTRIRRKTYVGLSFADGTVELHRIKLDDNGKTTGDAVTGEGVQDRNNCERLARVLADL